MMKITNLDLAGFSCCSHDHLSLRCHSGHSGIEERWNNQLGWSLQTKCIRTTNKVEFHKQTMLRQTII